MMVVLGSGVTYILLLYAVLLYCIFEIDTYHSSSYDKHY